MRNDFLEKHPLLSFFSRTVLKKLIASSPVVTFRKGATLFQEGAPCTGLYHILSGRCESYQTMSDGTLKHLEILGPGDYVGEPDLLGRGHYHTSARVITDSVLQQVQSGDLRSLLEESNPPSDTAVPMETQWNRSSLMNLGRTRGALWSPCLSRNGCRERS